jgi:transposase InsO family protein
MVIYTMEMRVKISSIIRSLNKHGQKVSLVAKELNIHRNTVYRWMRQAQKRYFTKESAVFMARGLRRHSTRPQRIAYAIPHVDKNRIIDYRKKYGITAEKIKIQLKLGVHHRTIHRFLRKEGLVREYGYHRRPRFQDTIHMHVQNTSTIGYLQMDVKVVTPELSGLPWTCYEYAIIDIFSRYKEAVILNQLDQDGAMSALLEILPRLPFKPIFIQTDNGLEFQRRFHEFCIAQGLDHHHIHKQNPNENAVIERSFRTDEEEFYFRLDHRPEHYDELRQLYAEYLCYYNKERIHMGINFKTPYQVVAEVVSD